MRLILLCEAFPPKRISAAHQLYALVKEWVRLGHEVTVITTREDLFESVSMAAFDGYEVITVKGPRMRDISNSRRAINELLLPFLIIFRLWKLDILDRRFDGVVWYSPTIFLAICIGFLKFKLRCPSYLILRDIFPQWAVDLQIIENRYLINMFRMFERFQYAISDHIGIQSENNTQYFVAFKNEIRDKIEILQNWVSPMPARKCGIDLSETQLSGRFIYVYAGNMGRSQNMELLFDLVVRMSNRTDVGFLFVGRGSETRELDNTVQIESLTNVLHFDEIDPEQIPDLLKQCDAGLVSLDARHTTHNIPGKFVTYMQYGLPVLSIVNPGNDLEEVVIHSGVGVVCAGLSSKDVYESANKLVDKVRDEPDIARRCRYLASTMFSVEEAANKIIEGLSGNQCE